MKREKIETYIGEKVRVILFNDTKVYKGVLMYDFPRKYYHLVGSDEYLIFRCSHVKKVRKTI